MMSEDLKLLIEAICVVHIIAIILAIVFFMIFYMKANKDYSTRAFLVLQISIIGWLVFKICKTVSITETYRWWFIVSYYFCACLVEVAFLEFAYSYYYGKPIKNSIRGAIYVIPVLQFAIIISNPLHHLFYSRFDFWGDSFGPLFYVYIIIVYGFISVGFFYGCLSFKRKFRGEKLWYKFLIASTIILPLIINLLYITKTLHKFAGSIGISIMFDVTPIVFVFSILVFVYATFNHEFIKLNPMMRHEIVHRIDTPICVIDSAFDVIYINEKLEESLGENALEAIAQNFKKLDVLKMINVKKEIIIEDQIFTVMIHEVGTLKEKQYLATLHRITDYKIIEGKILSEQELLVRTNDELEATIGKLRKLSKIGARNYVARELHDIIGHSLVVTIKLLEVARIYIGKDKNLSSSALADGVSSLEAGIDSMKNVASKDDNYTGKRLEKEIIKMFNRIKTTGIETRLSFKGLYYNLEEKTFDIINRICSELVTNSLKHAKTKEIFISVNINRDEISLLVMDNGKGCDKLILGNGLNGIKERLSLIDGKISFVTSAGEGFMSKVSIKN